MSVLKQIFGAMLVVAFVAGGIFVYDEMAAGRSAPGDGGQAGTDSVPVGVAAAERRPTVRRVEAVGSTMSQRAIEIVPLATGRIDELVFAPGQAVSAGDPLALLDDDIERANLTEAEAALRQVELAHERAHTLRQSNTVTVATLEQLVSQEAAARAALDRARRHLADRIVRAPFDGIVGLKRVDPGARVTESTVITTLDDRSEVEIEFSLPETLYGQVEIGQPVTAASAAFPGRVFDGVIGNIDSRVDPTSRSFKVRARVPNPDLTLPSGMFMHLSVALERREAVMVPEEAIVAEGNRTFVFVAEDDRAVRREVRLGQREVGAVEIADGVAPGERIVVDGTHRLRDGVAIRIVGEATAGDGEERPPSPDGSGPV